MWQDGGRSGWSRRSRHTSIYISVAERDISSRTPIGFFASGIFKVRRKRSPDFFRAKFSIATAKDFWEGGETVPKNSVLCGSQVQTGFYDLRKRRFHLE